MSFYHLWIYSVVILFLVFSSSCGTTLYNGKLYTGSDIGIGLTRT
ncbi:hypothetical protein BH10PSE19_BH10PSE19_08870 [soil metagenome]